MDSGFLSLELPSQPMHSVLVGVLSPAFDTDGSPAPITIAYLHQHLAERMDVLPALRWRVKRVPLGLHHPIFIEDPAFDLRRHLTAETLPAPGSTEQLEKLCAALGETCLDRHLPLWKMILVDGLANGRQALVFCVHHALMDATAVLVNLSRIFSEEPHMLVPASQPPGPDTIPSRSRLFARALLDHRKTPGKTWRLAQRYRKGQAALSREGGQTPVRVPQEAADTPQCSLNDTSAPARTFALATLSLADIRHIRRVADVTFNDVALAVVAGALRAYLIERNQLPSAPLVSNTLVGLDRPSDQRTWGNLLSGFPTFLATDVADPWARLRMVHQVSEEAKRRFFALGPDLLVEALECFPPWLAEPAVRRRYRRLKKGSARADANITVSTMMGPEAPWRLGFASVESFYLSGPPNSGVGSIVGIFSYCGKALATVHSFAAALEDPRDFVRQLEASLADLVAAADVASGGANGVFG